MTNAIPLNKVVDVARQLMNPEDIDHHESDLYLRVNEISRGIVARMESKSLVSTFIDNIEGKLWYDLPFLYHE